VAVPEAGATPASLLLPSELSLPLASLLPIVLLRGNFQTVRVVYRAARLKAVGRWGTETEPEESLTSADWTPGGTPWIQGVVWNLNRLKRWNT
jgi:hypothetical protein